MISPRKAPNRALPTVGIGGSATESSSAKKIRILVPIDFSKPSRRALQTAVDFAVQYGARIILLTVIEPEPLSTLAGNPLALTEDEFEAKLMSDLSVLGKRYVGTKHLEAVLVRTGKPFEQIVRAAGVLKTDLIVIATHGYTGLKYLLLGSTAERVIRHAPCPVLTVSPDQKCRWPTH